ncbi:ATP-binding protein [Glycomyces sp. L485]|uniref:TniB family NTP-binding protein n=1 Tax=Glycomyces sp. L485 TaxID=2909235 RepID=UPI001F4B1A16|nr:TniB family NTP-binding protein [Glycomyces sp. L485]MCH7230281.1 ATP-binding protein [Glycomyces sp. L485]
MTASVNRRTPNDQSDEVPPDHPLTTKEGWRAFVELDPAPPELLPDGELAALHRNTRAKYNRVRMGYHSELPLVSTPAIRKAAATARLLLQLNKHQISARRGGIISGYSGTGKTTALTYLGRAHELAVRKQHPEQGRRLPVVYVTVPPAATPKMLAVEFARFFGLSFVARANITDIVDAVCATASHVGVDLVLVDELHNLTAARSGAEASDQLKYFAERLRATFVYAGIDIESNGLFSGVRGRQLAGRFTLIPTQAFDYATEQEIADWHTLVATMESMLRLHQHEKGALPDLGEYLFERTGGMIGSLSQLIRGAAILAIEDGSEQITRDLLDIVPIDYAAELAARKRAAAKKTRSGTTSKKAA